MYSRIRVCFLTGSSSDWGGGSRVLYTTLRNSDLSRIEPLVLLSGDGPIRKELDARGIRCIAWGPVTEPTDKLGYLRALWRMLRLLRRERIEVLHINHRFWRPAEVLAAFLLRIPVLVHFHLVNQQEGSFMSRCSAAICVSQYVARESVPNTLAKHVVHNGVQLARFEKGRDMRAEWSIAQDAVIVAFLGQIREIKGVQDFITMALQIPRRDVCFLIAGECRDPQKFPGSYSEKNLKEMTDGDGRVHYIGYVNEVENVYRTADIVVVPSRWQEPLGLINLEAAASRKPIVATRVGGIPEAVDDGVSGYLVEPGDVKALASRVAELIADPALRKRMGDAGRARVERDFTIRPVREFESLLIRYARHRGARP